MKKVAVALGVLISSLSVVPIVRADSVPNAPYISTTGQGTIQAQPDMATLVIEVAASNASAQQAKKQVDSRVARYFDYLHQQGISDKDINAANVTTQAQYDYSEHGKPKLTGYQASRHVTVSLHQLGKLNTLLDGALAAGLNEIRSVTMGVEHPEQYQQRARQAAITDAITKGKSLAAGFDARLGSVWSVNYQTRTAVALPMVRMLSAQAATAQTSAEQTYQQQQLDFSDQVEVVFTLHPLNDAIPDDHKSKANP